MNDDKKLVKRLNNLSRMVGDGVTSGVRALVLSEAEECMKEAATRLQSLEAENARYKAALSEIYATSIHPMMTDTQSAMAIEAIARNALKED